MPCQSYDTSWADDHSDRDVQRVKREADKLARIACRALEELERNGIEDMLLLKDDETREWWAKHKEADAREKARVAEIERKERVRTEALAKLSHEERELLGLVKPRRHSKARQVTQIEDDDDIPF
jgi:hypothetical protein